ncbi:hypothetical protein FRUB_04341 [Fimbriiglobus ruber]|uniref:Uncharacterized protein n=1 Tax=Fimbriiglobus ruber TaxID=1908690 RepID=A0A225DML8_9BACT|nr:hypothetical protein FRUB_04341 [Fimbriiglobus ruber]
MWVALGLLVTHPTWGTTALPVLARLYVRAKDVAGLPAADRPAFRTTHARAVELVRWAVSCLASWGKGRPEQLLHPLAAPETPWRGRMV